MASIARYLKLESTYNFLLLYKYFATSFAVPILDPHRNARHLDSKVFTLWIFLLDQQSATECQPVQLEPNPGTRPQLVACTHAMLSAHRSLRADSVKRTEKRNGIDALAVCPNPTKEITQGSCKALATARGDGSDTMFFISLSNGARPLDQCILTSLYQVLPKTVKPESEVG